MGDLLELLAPVLKDGVLNLKVKQIA